MKSSESLSLDIKIARGKFGYVNPHIKEANFSPIPCGYEYTLDIICPPVSYHCFISTDAVLDYIKNDGSEPADMYDLVDWGVNNPKEPEVRCCGYYGEGSISALNSIWHKKGGYHYVVYLGNKRRVKRRLDLKPIVGCCWPEQSYLLVRRKKFV